MKILEKKLSYLDGAVLIFSNVVGVGIFTTPGIVAGSINHEIWFMLAWLAGGIFSFVGALAYAQLSSLYPRAGGEYLYLRKAYGHLVGFLSGWTSFVAGFSGAIAASAIGFAIYLHKLFPTFEGVSQSFLAITLIIVVSVIHLLSVKAGSRFHYWLGGMALLAILIVIAAGIFSGDVSVEPVLTPVTSTDFNGFFLAMIPILFTYSGWNAAVYVAEEIKDPSRNMVRALLLGTSVVIIIYLLLNFLFVRIMGLTTMADTIEVGYTVGESLLGGYGVWVITVIILLALLSSVSAMIMAGPRIYFAMSRDGLFPKAIRQVHPKFKTPYIAIVAQSVWSIVLTLSGTFEDILLYTGFSLVLFSGLSVATLLTHSTTQINIVKRTGFLVFVVVSALIVLNGLYIATGPTLMGCAIITLGVPVYFWYNRKRIG